MYVESKTNLLRSFNVKLGTGHQLRRYRRHILKTKEDRQANDDQPIIDAEIPDSNFSQSENQP